MPVPPFLYECFPASALVVVFTGINSGIMID